MDSQSCDLPCVHGCDQRLMSRQANLFGGFTQKACSEPPKSGGDVLWCVKPTCIDTGKSSKLSMRSAMDAPVVAARPQDLLYMTL